MKRQADQRKNVENYHHVFTKRWRKTCKVMLTLNSIREYSSAHFSHSIMSDCSWTAVGQASLSITNSWSVLKFMSIELVMPSNHLILCRLLLLLPSIFPSIRFFFRESVLRIRWPKYWSFGFSISPSKEYLGLISFTIWLVRSPCSPMDSQECSSLQQFKNINSPVLSSLYSPSLTSTHDC